MEIMPLIVVILILGTLAWASQQFGQCSLTEDDHLRVWK